MRERNDNIIVSHRWSSIILLPEFFDKKQITKRFVRGIGQIRMNKNFWIFYNQYYRKIILEGWGKINKEGIQSDKVLEEIIIRKILQSNIIVNKLPLFYPYQTPYKKLKEKDFHHRYNFYPPFFVVYEVIRNDPITEEEINSKTISELEKKLRRHVKGLNRKKIIEAAIKAVYPERPNLEYDYLINKTDIVSEIFTALFITHNPEEHVNLDHRYKTKEQIQLSYSWRNYDYLYLSPKTALLIINSGYLESKKLRRKLKEHIFSIIDFSQVLKHYVNNKRVVLKALEEYEKIGTLVYNKKTMKIEKENPEKKKTKGKKKKQVYGQASLNGSKFFAELFLAMYLNPKTYYYGFGFDGKKVIIPVGIARKIFSYYSDILKLNKKYQQLLLDLLREDRLDKSQFILSLLSMIQVFDKKKKENLLDHVLNEWKMNYYIYLNEKERKILDQLFSVALESLSEYKDIALLHKSVFIGSGHWQRLIKGLTRTQIYKILGTRKKSEVDKYIGALINKNLITFKKLKGAPGRPVNDERTREIYLINLENSAVAFILYLMSFPDTEIDEIKKMFFE